MDTRDLADRADRLLALAADDRRLHNGDGCLHHLQQAQRLIAGADLTALQHRIAWRIAKAGFDFDRPDAMLDGLEPLLDGAPFAHVPAGRRALSAIADRWWDTRGYGDDRILRLWLALMEAYREDGDPWMAATAAGKAAWHLACSGDNHGLDALVERYLGLDPKRFGRGPHRHPRAPDTMTSVWWAQLELVRTGLWASVWTRRRERARDLLDAFLDAAEAAGLGLQDDVWFLDPLCRAAVAFDQAELIETHADTWLAGLGAVEGPRGTFHSALARGLIAAWEGRDDHAVQLLRAAVSAADSESMGAEWALDARLELARVLGDTTEAGALRAEAVDLGRRFGIGWAARS